MSEWMAVPITQLIFPPMCAGCAGSTDATREFVARSTFSFFWRILGVESYLVVPVPFCERCETRFRKQRRRAALAGLLCGAVAGGLVAALVPFEAFAAPGGGVLAARTCAVLTGLALGPWMGFLLGERSAGPVHLRRYSSRRHRVELALRHPEVARAFVAARPDSEAWAEPVR